MRVVSRSYACFFFAIHSRADTLSKSSERSYYREMGCAEGQIPYYRTRAPFSFAEAGDIQQYCKNTLKTE